MRILVAVAKYTTLNVNVYQSFVRGRNILYKEEGIDVSILNFYTRNDYFLDNIPIYSLHTIKSKLQKEGEKFDLLVCHAPNIRNHYFFLQKYRKYFPKLVLIFHGHEVLNVNKVYSKPYSYVKRSAFFSKLYQQLYDYLKLSLWNKYYSELLDDTHFLFVSKWMYDEFVKWVKVFPKHFSITYNNIGKVFEEESYDYNKNKLYDFITIRGDLDGSKYCIDIVNQMAKDNFQYKFLIVGKGEFFNYNKKAQNIDWVDKQLSHAEIVNYLNKSRCALMPTRTDAQGLMMCEMASFGMPLITSDIPVCREVFYSFINVCFIDNNQQKIILNQCLENLEKGIPYSKNTKYHIENTVMKEVELFRLLVD